jgi:hypothetical protein
MSAPPEANTEYSRGSEASERLFVRASAPPSEGREDRGFAITAVALTAALGALLVLISQFAALYHVHVVTTSAPVKTVGTGANHAWAPIPIALLAAALAFAVYRKGSRAALVALMVLGIVALVIALVGDLPDAHATGIVGSGASQYAEGTSTPSAGLYMETLGAILLLISGGVGLLLPGPARQPSDAAARPRSDYASRPRSDAAMQQPSDAAREAPPQVRERILRRMVLPRGQEPPKV